jgi:hypothetical protein
MGKQTCLEKAGILERKDEIVRSDYNIEDQYSSTHKDAISDNDAQGKGHPTVKGHTHWLPSCDGMPNNMIKYDNFATSPEDSIGGLYDIEGRAGIPGRKQQMARSMYTYEDQYGPTSVDTSANVSEGQYFTEQTK